MWRADAEFSESLAFIGGLLKVQLQIPAAYKARNNLKLSSPKIIL